MENNPTVCPGMAVIRSEVGTMYDDLLLNDTCVEFADERPTLKQRGAIDSAHAVFDGGLGGRLPRPFAQAANLDVRRYFGEFQQLAAGEELAGVGQIDGIVTLAGCSFVASVAARFSGLFDAHRFRTSADNGDMQVSGHVQNGVVVFNTPNASSSDSVFAHDQWILSRLTFPSMSS